MMRPATGAGLLLALLGTAACAGPPAAEPPTPEPLPEPAAEPFEPPPPPPPVIWTSRPDVTVEVDGRRVSLPRPMTRLDVVDADALGMLVRCAACERRIEGWVVEADVVHEPLPPEIAAFGTLAEFALAVRHAANQRDLQGLRRVMDRRFTHSFGGPDGVDAAIERWGMEGFRDLGALPFLMDRGLETADGEIWVAPPEFLTDADYRRLRAGFRRQGDRWVWLFLVRGD